MAYFVSRPRPIGRADGKTPARIFGFEKAHDEVRDQHPPEKIERGVLEFGALKERQRRERDGKRRRDLRQTRAAQVPLP